MRARPSTSPTSSVRYTRGEANPGVRRFFKETDAAEIYVSAQTIGEIRCGLENIRSRRDVPQAKKFEKWLDVIVGDYADKILSFDEECAQVCGRLMSQHFIKKTGIYSPSFFVLIPY